MSTTPNYDKLPLDVRVYQEQMFFNDLSGANPFIVKPDDKIGDKQGYYRELRMLNDSLSQEHASLDVIREEVAERMALTTPSVTGSIPVVGIEKQEGARDGAVR